VMIAATPAERHRTRTIGEAPVTTDAFEFAGGWCVRHRTRGERVRRDYALCFDGTAVIGGDDLVMFEGAWRRTRFGQTPPDPEDPIGQ